MLKISKRYFLFLTIFIYCLLPGIADAELSIGLDLDRSEATLSDSVRLRVSISGSRDSSSRPEIEGLDNFHVSTGGTSSRVEIINGKMSSGIDFTYFIQPKYSGDFIIGPAKIKIKDKVYTSNTATLSIAKSSVGEEKDHGTLFLTSNISKNSLYVEEQAVYILKLYRRANIRDISLNLPELENISLTQLGKPSEYQSMQNGHKYQVLEVRYALIASKAGEYRIGPAAMNMTVIQSTGSSQGGFFNDPFFSFSNGRPVTVSGEIVNLEVTQLPEQGRPDNFSGLTGVFDLESELNPHEIKAGESATLTIKVKGRGNINLIPDIKPPVLAEAKIYDDQPIIRSMHDKNGLGGEKIMKWAIVPEKEGTLKISPLTLTYFDTGAGMYNTLSSKEYFLKVLPSESIQKTVTMEANAGRREPGTEKREIRELGRDILPIHTTVKNITTSSTQEIGAPVAFILLISPAFIFLVTFTTLRMRDNLLKNKGKIRSANAFNIFKKQIGTRDLLASDLILAVRDYLNNRLCLEMGSITADEAFEILISRQVKKENAEKLKRFLKLCEDTVYTGKGDVSNNMDMDLTELIKNIEKEIV